MRVASAISAVLFVATSALAAPLMAQDAPARAAVHGQVMDAGTGEGLAGATVRLALLPDSASGDPAGLAAADTSRTRVTAADGRYRFARVRPGRYLLTVERLGYRAATVRVRVGGAGQAGVSVGLEVEPVTLEPMAVRGQTPEPYDRASASAAGSLPAVRLRQARYLAPDVRGLTHRELLESVTLGQTDIFRALQRLPGVGARDEWSAGLWTRGAAWDQTRVVLDGMPLFSPVHGAGVFSGINADAIGSVYLHPGARPARLGGGSAAVLELETRPAREPGLNGFGELSLATARVALDQRLGDGGWVLAGRRTYVDWISRGVERALDDQEVSVPYDYVDLTGRADWRLGDATKLEASGIWAEDAITGSIPDVIHGSSVVWGNLAGRLTLETPVLGIRTRHTVGATRYRAVADSVPPGPATEGFSAPGIDPLDHGLNHASIRGEWLPGHGWEAGYEFSRLSTRAVGIPPSPYLTAHIHAVDTLAHRSQLTGLAGWYERRWRAGPVEIEGGLRAETGSAVAGAGDVRLAPRFGVRWHVADGLTVAATAGRSYQYAQAILPIGLPFASDTPLFPSGALWLIAGDSIPALRTDIVGVGGELWLDRRTLLTVNGYARAGTGLLVQDPRPGLAVDRPLFVTADERARGIETSLRRLAGRWTGSVGYTYARTELDAAGYSYPAPSDRRHTVDVTSRVRITSGLEAAAAFTYATGAPFTRFTTTQLPGEEALTPVLGEPNRRRMPVYASLDLSLDWTKRFDSWSLGLYLQLRNALNRDNTASYAGSHHTCGTEATEGRPDGTFCFPSGQRPYVEDRFLFAAPTIPLIGLRLRF